MLASNHQKNVPWLSTDFQNENPDPELSFIAFEAACKSAARLANSHPIFMPGEKIGASADKMEPEKPAWP